MTTATIPSTLGLLQDDAEHPTAWQELREATGFVNDDQANLPAGVVLDETRELLVAARRAHEGRREFEAVAELLRIEAALCPDAEGKAGLLRELARVQDDEMLDEAAAVRTHQRILALMPGDGASQDFIERSEARRGKWRELVAKYVDEAKEASEAGFKSSLLVSAAETAFRYGRLELGADAPVKEGKEKGKKKKDPKDRLKSLFEEVAGGLSEALELDPKNRRASLLLERVLREQGRWEDVAATLAAFAAEAPAKEDRIASLVRLARLCKKKLGSVPRAAAAYERILDLAPGHSEATRELVDHFTESQMWDHLVALYDEQLGSGAVRSGQEVGVVLQIAMVHWKMRGRPDAAEPYFERLRKSEPTHPGMLSFFRDWCGDSGDTARLVAVLSEAQRAMPDGPERGKLSAEIAQLSEDTANAQRAIEQWRSVLRQDAGNADARDALKRLYRQTAAWNALADLLRGELERVAETDSAARLSLLREIAGIYREHIKSESAVVTVLSQVVAIDSKDKESLRELVRVYEGLARWRDLLTTQLRLAELEDDEGSKAEIYRAVARRWLDQFSNVQNAMEAYEKLLAVKPGDEEATQRLRELYTKRRAYKPLYDLFDAQQKTLPEGAERRELWMEMGRLASERLDKGPEAVALFKRVLEEDPGNAQALDTLEKQAERDKDFATVALVLERRAELATDDQTKVGVLHKLGGVYTDRLHDTAQAVRTWRKVLALSPGHPKALRVLREGYLAAGDFDGLGELYAELGDWDGLAEVLSGAADRATDSALKVDLSYRAASIYEDKLGSSERAFRSYERVLSVKPDDARAVAALIPIYQADEKWARLPALYEVLLSQAEDKGIRVDLLRKLADVTGQRLGDKASAFAYASKLYELDPESLDEYEAYARAAGDYAAFVQRVRDRAQDPQTDKAERLSLLFKLAQITHDQLGQKDEAIALYKTLVTEYDSAEAMTALDRVLRGGDRADDLRWLFRLRVERAGGQQKIDCLTEWALLEEEALSSPERAADLYREMLTLDAKHGAALRALSRLLQQAGDVAGAAKVLEQDRDLREGSERVARELELARLYAGSLAKPGLAFEAATRALEVSPNEPEAIAIIEQLLPVAETRSRAAKVLEVAYAETGQLAKQAEVLMVIVATAASKEDRLALYERLTDVYERLGALPSAFEVTLHAAQEFPQDLRLWDKLSMYANRTQRTQQFVQALEQTITSNEGALLPNVEMDLAERAATLSEEMLGDIDRALPYWERVLLRDPQSERAFTRLKQILTTRERWADLQSLYERVVDLTEDVPRKCDLLSEAALVAEEITQDLPRAVGFYERILSLDEGHEDAMLALDKLYQQTQDHEKLAKLLQKRIEGSVGELVPLKVRIGKLLFGQLGDPKGALSYLEEVLTEDTGERDARELVEKCLELPALRARAAVVLENVYAERQDNRDLVRILEVRTEFAADDIERRELFRRIAELRDDKLTDDAGAFATYARMLPLSPDDAAARARFLEIGRRLGASERAAEVLQATAKAADAPQPRAEILTDVAKIFEASGAPDRALSVWREILALDPEDVPLALPAAQALERLYEAAGKTKELCEVLALQVKLEDNGDTRRALLGRLGTLAETGLGDTEQAVLAWKQRADDDPSDAEALVALDRLYERAGNLPALVEVLRMREQLTEDSAERRTLMVRAAKALEASSEVEEAILAYRAVLDDFGSERSILVSLSGLYDRAGRDMDLVDTLTAEIALSESESERVDLLYRIGEVRRTRMKDLEASIESYREALLLDPGHAPSRAALEALLGNDDARREAAQLLRPLYEADGLHDKLLRVLDIEAEFAEGVTEKLQVLALSAQVAEERVGDADKAFAYVSIGLRAAAGEAELPDWLVVLYRLLDKTKRYQDGVDLLQSLVPEILDEEAALGVLLRIAEISRDQLGRNDLARTFFQKALELRSDDERALTALESLHEKLSEHVPLMDVLKRRAEAQDDLAQKKAILFKQAKLAEDKLQDRTMAAATYEAILDLEMDAEALAATARLYESLERWDDLVGLYERELGGDNVPGERRAELSFKLGETFRLRLSDMDRAFDQYEAALREEPQHEPTIAAIEDLMGQREHAVRSAEILEGVYLRRLDWRKVMKTKEARLSVDGDPEERRTLLRSLAKLHEEQEENYREALEVTARLLREDITDEGTWAELERLARVANAERRLAEIYAEALGAITSDEPATAKLCARAAELFEQTGDKEQALSWFRRAYAFAPEDSVRWFQAIDALLVSLGRSKDRVQLHSEALDFRSDPEDRLRIFHTIAALSAKELGDDEAAIAAYRSAVEIDETDAAALDALAALYEKGERFRDLADLLRRRAEQSALPEEETRYRAALAKLHEQRLADIPSAIDEYQAVLESAIVGSARDASKAALARLLQEDAHRARVIDILKPVYEAEDDWEKLIALGDERLKVATDASDKVVILREVSRLWEERAKDPQRAFSAMRDAFVLDPEDGEAREQLDRLAVLTERWDDLANAYEVAIGKVEGVGQQELLSALARLHDARRDDPRKALDAWERLHKLDESELPPLEEMDMLATLLSDWEVLVRVLGKKVELLDGDEERASTWRRIGEAKRDMLDDAAGAIDAYERALELEPDSAFTVDNLIALYEAKNDAARLVDLYKRRIELCGEDDEGLRFQLMVDAADKYDAGLGERGQAIALLNDALTMRPGDRDVVAKLGKLYEREEQWGLLLENLRLRAANAENDAERRELLAQIGALLGGKIDDAEAALEAYREVLAGGFHEGVAEQVRALGEAREEIRLAAAEMLEPVLRAAGRGEDLAAVLELRLRAQQDPAERAQTLRALAELLETQLQDPKRALEALLRAVSETPDEATLHDSIVRVAEAAGGDSFASYATVLDERARALFEAEITGSLYLRLGTICAERLKDLPRAASAFRLAAERRGDSVEILSTLEPVLAGLGETKELAQVLERRVALTSDPRAQADLYHRLGVLQLGELGDRTQGVATLRLSLEQAPDHEASRLAVEALLPDEALFDDAFDILQSVYRKLSMGDALAGIYERRVERAPSQRDKLLALLELSTVLGTEVGAQDRAQNAAERAVTLDPTDEAAVARLEELALAGGTFQAAQATLAAALEQYESRRAQMSSPNLAQIAESTAAALWVRLSGWRKEHLGDLPGAEAALTRALAANPQSAEIVASIEALQRAAGRERDLVATLRTRAKLETDLGSKRSVYTEAYGLSQSPLADAELGESILRDFLQEDEADAWALGELTVLRERASDFAEVTSLLQRRAQLSTDAGEISRLMHQAADVLETRLGKKDDAIAMYLRILEQEPTDAQAASRLRALYEAQDRFEELAKLLGRLVDVADSAQARSLLRVDIARIQGERFGAKRDAVDTLRAILEEEPDHPTAATQLAALLEGMGAFGELSDHLSAQIARAQERGDAKAEQSDRVRLATVLEGPLADPKRALETYEAVLAQEPTHHEALVSVARLSEAKGAWERAASALTALLGAESSEDETVALSLRLADAEEKQGNVDGVESALRRALTVRPRATDVRGRLRTLYDKQKRWEQLAAMLAEDADQAKDTETDATKLAQEQTRLLRKAAEIHMKERSAPADAVPLLERAAELAPQDRELLLLLCDAYSAASRERDATQVLERIIASFGTKRTKELSLYHHRLGRALSRLGDRDVALTQLDLAFKIDPGSIEVLRDLGTLAIDIGDLERAQKTFRALLLQKLDANSGITKGEVFLRLGEISHKQGDKPKAIQMLERALENEPGLAQAKTMLAELKG
jgi:tetratricopeptide (TPR) repeat protein